MDGLCRLHKFLQAEQEDSPTPMNNEGTFSRPRANSNAWKWRTVCSFYSKDLEFSFRIDLNLMRPLA